MKPIPTTVPTKPGIYFGLDFDLYRKIDAVNAGGLKNLLISEMRYWANTDRNPAREDNDTVAKSEGRLYHTRILEGKDVFYKMYAPDYYDDPSDKGLLRTIPEIRGALQKIGGKVSFTNKLEGATRLIQLDPKARVKEIEEQRHRAQYKDREFLKWKMCAALELHAAVIQKNPFMRQWLAGGVPEVTVVWWDDEYGVMFKCRMDYMKMEFPVDLKTYANQMDRAIDKAIAIEIARYKYKLQAALYLRGHRAAKILAQQGLVYGNVAEDWINLFPKYETTDFRFIFFLKGNAPEADGRIMLKGSAEEAQGLSWIREGMNRYHSAVKKYGPNEAWVTVREPQIIQNDDAPSYEND